MLNLPGAGGAGVKVDVAEGQATAAAVGRIVADMKETIGVIQKHAANTTPTWQGKAGAAFDGTHTDWNKEANTLNQLLDQIKAQMTNGFAGYEDQDSAAAGHFGV